ncbi:MAG: hypothetical protein ABFC84_04080 [Veillonellales bacterium]
MNVINLADYYPKKLIFCGDIHDFSVNMVDGNLVLCVNLNNEDFRFMKLKETLSLWSFHEASKILLNAMIGKIPICIHAEYVDDFTYHINDIGYYVQDN